MKHIKTTVSLVLLTLLLLTMSPVINVSAKTLSASAGEYIAAEGIKKSVYEQLKSGLAAISGGQTTSTTVNVTEGLSQLCWTTQELGISSVEDQSEVRQAVSDKLASILDISRLVYALQADCPYETYWYDALGGIAVGYTITSSESSVVITALSVSFTPMAEYAGATENTVDAAKISTALRALENAKDIVAQNASLNDRDKLEAYYTKICELVSYDENAPAGYSSSLQMINVFDGNPSTNVVCEGYAKAFKYLCDLSQFEGKVYCYTVNGEMDGGAGAGAHTWNIVSVNGKLSLVDVTNSDAGTIGQNGHLFLASPTSSANEATYSFVIGNVTIKYSYDQYQEDLFVSGYPTLEAIEVSTDPIIAKAEMSIISPIAEGNPSYEVVTSDPRYTARVVSWRDPVLNRDMTAQDTFIEGYKYEVLVEFIPAEGYSFDENTKFYVNGTDLTVADGRPELRRVVFLATPTVKLAYDISVEGGKATVNGTEVTKAYPGDKIVLTANANTDTTLFQKWEVVSGGVNLSNTFVPTDVFFYMPECPVSIKANFTTLSHTHKFDQRKADDKYLATAATCTAKAEYYYSCACGESEGKANHTFESGELLSHVFDKQVYSGCLATEATCTVPATYYYSCECGEIEKDDNHVFISDEIAAHTEGDWIIDKEAAVGVEGSKHTECTVCGATVTTQAIPALSDDTTDPADKGCASSVTLATLLFALIPAGIIIAKKKD